MGIVLAIMVFVFILVCIGLILLVLIQSDKGGGISGAIGGGLGGANSLLGTQDTANILTRGTAIFGGVFLILCIAMSWVIGQQNATSQKSLLHQRAEKQQSFSPSSILDGNSSLPLQGGASNSAPAATPGATPNNALPIAPADGQK
jgi:preprotein translocase subunit SecG